MKRLYIVVIAIFIGLLLGEAAVRLAGLAPEVAVISVGRFRLSEHRDIAYEPVPDLEISGKLNPFDEFRGRSNSLGYRDREHEKEKPAGTFRIVVIGDSISVGLKVDKLFDIYPLKLEQLFSAAGKNVEVINFGVSGYNTQQEVATLVHRGMAFSPDLVLLQYALNDKQRDDGGIVDTLIKKEHATEGYDTTIFPHIVHQSALYRFVVYGVVGGGLRGLRKALVVSLTRLYSDSVEESLDRLRRTVGTQRAKVLVVAFPGFSTDRRSPDLPKRFRALSHQYSRLEKLTQKFGFSYLDLRTAFRNCAAETRKPFGHDIFHPTAAGHACAAKAIEQYLLAKKLVP